MKKIILTIPLLLLFLHVMYAIDGPNMWTQSFTTTSQIWVLQVAPSSQQTIYAGSGAAGGTGVWKSTNDGINWMQMNNGLTNTVIQALSVSKTNPNIVMVGSTNTGTSPGIYRTTDGGSNWTLVNNGITDTLAIQALEIDPVNPNIAYVGIFTGTGNASVGLYKTTNGGQNWFAANTGIGANKNMLAIAINPLNTNVVYCGTSFMLPNPPGTGPTFVYKSVDAGATWTNMSTGLPPLTTDINPIRVLAVSNADTSVVIAGLFMNTTTNGGLFVSTNGGNSWIKKHNGMPSIAGTLIRAAIIRPGSSTEFFVGLDGGTNKAVWRTIDGGNLWTQFLGGPMIASHSIRALGFRTLADSTLYAGVANTTGTGNGILEYTWIPVGITGNNGKIPKDFALYQNYPNPFNPVTNILFDIPKENFVTLKVYDIRGKEVKTLAAENRQAGSYNITFNAAALASGVYFYKLTAGDFARTMKMVLVK
jgi:photosystem II stability/assembly factor-like uncharacterized protein